MPSKLHLNLSSQPACGRQLNNHRQARSQQSDAMLLAPSYEVFLLALTAPKPKACRHCARAAGLLPPVTRRQLEPEDSDENAYAPELYDEAEEDSDE